MAEFETETKVADEAVSEPEKEENAASAFSEDAGEAEDDIPVDPKKRKRRRRLIILGVIALAVIGLVVANVIQKKIKEAEALKNMYIDVEVEKRTIKKSITGSSSIEPNDSYNVMTIKSGDIISDYFKEGDTVKKGDKLYQFDDEDARNSLSTAQNALTKAQQAYIDAVKQKSQTVSANNLSTQSTRNAINKTLNSLNDAQKSYDDQYLKSDINGKVTNVSVKEGDSISIGMKVAEIYDDSEMKIRLPFNDYDAESVSVGDMAEVTVTASGDVLYGTVTEKATAATASNAHTMVVYTTIEVTNPGALTTGDRGSAVVNGVACADSANFEYTDTQMVTAKSSGTLETLNISEGDSVYAGEQLAYIKSDAVSTSLNNAQLNYDDAVLSLQKQVLQNDTFSQDSAIKNANLAVDDAKTNLQKAQKAVDDFVVEAPIEGTVVKKNAKSGDTRDSSNSTEALCVIYDLSSLKMSIEVDETEIALVKTGQRATITADAVDGEFEGEVTKVPVDGVNTNGVTTYTIEVQITEYGDLLPGMNVDAEIVVEEADDVLTVPLNSVNRGNIVFVKEDGIERANDVTDIIREKKNNPSATTGNDDKEKQRSELPVVSGQDAKEKEGGKKLDLNSAPAGIDIPDGYRAVMIETGINDNSYIEVKSGLGEGDKVRTLNAKTDQTDFGGDDMMSQMSENRRQQMHQMQTGGGMSGGMGGGMSGGGMRSGGGGPR